MKRASLIAAVLLLQLSYFPLVAQASPEEKAVGKAAMFYRHMKMARGMNTPSPDQVADISKKPSGRVEVIPQPKTQPEPVKTNPVRSTPAK